MNDHPTSRDIQAWLSAGLQASRIESTTIFDRDSILFRAWPRGGRAVELEVDRKAIEDFTSAMILADLEDSDVLTRLTTDPSMRLCYGFKRDVPHFESRTVVCEGRQYRIVRDASHNVRIYDGTDERLKGTPTKC